MDYFKTIHSDGYRYEDLTDENKLAMDWLSFLRDEFKNYEFNTDDESETLCQIKAEFAEAVINDVKDWLDMKLADYQITMIEGQEDSV